MRPLSTYSRWRGRACIAGVYLTISVNYLFLFGFLKSRLTTQDRMPIHTTGTAASQIDRQQAASYSSQSGSCRDTPDSQPSQQLIDLSKPFLAVQILQCSVSGFLAILTPLICNLTCRLLGKPARQAPRPPAFWPARKPLPQLPRPCPSYAEQPCLLRASGPASLHAAK
jgi:hypothetical protein